MLGNALMRPFFNNKSTNAFSCLLNALPSAEVNIAIIVFVIKEGDKVIDLSIKARVNELGSQLSVAH
jgi:F0F1-type ATP synthase delta subunit